MLLVSKNIIFSDHNEDNNGKRKKRRNMWQKGLTPKKKKYSKNSKVYHFH